MFKQTLLPIWSLIFGLAMITTANALQNSLLGLRASIENFHTASAGYIMAGFYVGFIAGSIFVPNWIKNVGHIRVFAAVASLASITILLQSAIVTPWFWILMRIGTGLCYAGLYIVVESWLNTIATNDNRGRLLSIYVIVIWASQTFGQLLLNVAPPSGYGLFIIASVLISVALVPMLLVQTPSPTISLPEKLDLIGLVRTAPLGATAVIVVGFSCGIIMGLAAVYGKMIGMDVAQISLFVGASYIGGMLIQWPIGKISDRQDRRLTLFWVSLVACAVALIVPYAHAIGNTTLMVAGMFLLGGFAFPLYSLGSSHINDQLRPEQILSASSGMILLQGAGGAVGPIIASTLMEWTVVDSMFYFLSVAHISVALLALYRMSSKPPMVVEEQGSSINMGLSVTSVVNTEMWVESDPELETVAEVIEADGTKAKIK
ncbi:MFS transporter [Marinomonas fungiae]|uniref:MFS transporter n=1 Tax=Marinomonas fungiae TaxID=1137284 RepID=UPI003A8CD58F